MEGEKGLKLFGVRIFDEERRWRKEGGGDGKDDPVKQSMLKSLSMVDLASCVVTVARELRAGDHEYLSDGGLEQAARRGGQERKRGDWMNPTPAVSYVRFLFVFLIILYD